MKGMKTIVGPPPAPPAAGFRSARAARNAPWAAQSSTFSNADDKPTRPQRGCRRLLFVLQTSIHFPFTEFTKMIDSYKTPLVVVGRVLLALMFIMAGFSKLGNIEGTAGYIASGGLPMATRAGGDRRPARAGRWHRHRHRLPGTLGGTRAGPVHGAASLLFHKFWAVPADQAMVQQLMFMKNLSVAGGLFIVAALGAGPASVDARRRQGLAWPERGHARCVTGRPSRRPCADPAPAKVGA